MISVLAAMISALAAQVRCWPDRQDRYFFHGVSQLTTQGRAE
jgi:hypothetical protein